MINLKKRILVCLAVLFIMLGSVCFAEQNNEPGVIQSENYLVGMSVRKTFANDYSITLRFKNNTDNTYKLKELGNNSYILSLPQVRSTINERDIVYENEPDDIKIVFSEKQDLIHPEIINTQINFRTKESAILRVQALAESSEMPENMELPVQNDFDEQEEIIPNGIWYLLIAFVFACITIILALKSSNKKTRKLKSKHKKVKSNQQKQNKENAKKQDLTLMPGVPELPFLDKKDNSKIINKENNLDLYNPENISEVYNQNNSFRERDSFADRFRNRDFEKNENDLIYIDRDSYIENLSSINDVTTPHIKNDKNSSSDDDNNIQAEYDNLMNAFKNLLKTAHNISDNSLVPEVKDAFAISDKVGFCLVKLGEKTSFVGNIGDKVFLIKTFSSEELVEDTLFMEFCAENQNSQIYSVILNNFKALIRVTDNDISLIGDYTK